MTPRILGPESLIFGVDDLDAARKYLSDYGLRQSHASASGMTFEALDGTSLVACKSTAAGLPPAVASTPNLRETLYGVADKVSLEVIGAELGRDRKVTLGSDGVLRSVDDDGYPIGFQLSARRPLTPPPDRANVPGQPPGRGFNCVAAVDEAQCRPATLSHLVLFSHDAVRAEAFYAGRLGFRTVDYFTNLGPFMRPAANHEHHTLFIINNPQGSLGVQHFTFHLSGANELLKAGFEFSNKGYQSFWGPGRHILGSNYFWYFNSPFGGLMEFDADMDLHDDRWVPRRIPANADTSQTFLLQATPKWYPGG